MERLGNINYFRFTPFNLKDGFSNTSQGKISIRTNFKNNYILLEEELYRHLISAFLKGKCPNSSPLPLGRGGCQNSYQFYDVIALLMPRSVKLLSIHLFLFHLFFHRVLHLIGDRHITNQVRRILNFEERLF